MKAVDGKAGRVASRRGARGELRVEILRAGRELFARRGFAGTSMDDIAGRVGVTKGALYWHFRGKEDLLSAILEDIREEWQRVVATDVAAAGDPLDKIERLFANYERLLGESPEICLLLQRLQLDGDERFAERVRTTFAQTAGFIARILDEAVAAGHFARPVDTRLVAYELLGSWAGCYLHCRTNPELDLGAVFADLKGGLLRRLAR